MSLYDPLPFPRGQTHSDGRSDVLSASYDPGYLGRTFRVKDTIHNSGKEVVLRAVKWNASDTTASYKCVSFATGAGDLLKEVDALANAAGEISKPLDDAMYGKAIKQYDIIYVVDEGPCYVLSSTTAGPSGPHTPVTVASGGALGHGAATTNNHVLGYTDITLTTANTNEAVLVYVAGGMGYEY